MKFLPKNILVETIHIVILAVVFGFISNQFRPDKVKISFSRPPIEFVTDNILAQQLPDVGINITEPTEEPIFLIMKQVISLLEKDLALLIDVRNEKEYQKEHIPGARHLSQNELLKNNNSLPILPNDKWLICYCEGYSCDLAESLAYELIYAGYQMVAVFPGGLEEWKNGNPIQTKSGARTNDK